MNNVAELARRAASIPDAIAAFAPPARPPLEGLVRWVVTGVGASEGPARLFAAELAELEGIAVRFVPVSAFHGSHAPAGDALVVVTQGFSPNAQLPLAHRARYRATIVATSLDPDADARCQGLLGAGVSFLRYGPLEEGDGLLRIVGPTLATRLLLWLADEIRAFHGEPPPPWTAELPRIATAMRSASLVGGIDPAWLAAPASIVTAGADGERAFGLATKLVESLVSPEVAISDLCGIVHGPLQSFYDRRRLLLVLESTAEARALRERLEQVVVPERHHVRVFSATLPGPLAYFEYAAAFDAVIVSALRARPRDLTRWPGQGRDGAIYDVGAEILRAR